MLTTILTSIGYLPSCAGRQEIIIGFAGGLTGRVAELGVAGRDGVTLAVEQINADGGINGHPVRLIVQDDKQDADVAQRVVTELIDEGAVAIIGHMTSSMTIATIDKVNASSTVMISPTTSSTDLTGLDDNFFRVYPSISILAAHLAEYAGVELGSSRVGIIYDTRNLSYTGCFKKCFATRFTEAGGSISTEIPFESGANTGFLNTAKTLVETQPDTVLILASAVDTAMICQQLSKTGNSAQILVSDWSATRDLLEYGSSTVENLVFVSTFEMDSQDERYLEFSEQFNARFGLNPGFAETHSYDCTQILFRALESGSVPLKQSILDLGPVEGLQTTINLDKFGDVERELFITTVKDGRFKAIK